MRIALLVISGILIVCLILSIHNSSLYPKINLFLLLILFVYNITDLIKDGHIKKHGDRR